MLFTHPLTPSKAEFYKGIATQLIQLGGEIPSNLQGFQAALILRDLDLISSNPQLGKLFLTQIILSSPDDPAHLKNDELLKNFIMITYHQETQISFILNWRKVMMERVKQHLISDHLKRRNRIPSITRATVAPEVLLFTCSFVSNDKK